jgi:hypothetical protein
MYQVRADVESRDNIRTEIDEYVRFNMTLDLHEIRRSYYDVNTGVVSLETVHFLDQKDVSYTVIIFVFRQMEG